MDILIRRDGEGAHGGGRERENLTADLLLDLEGLGPLRIDAALSSGSVNVRFTTSAEQVGAFLEAELLNLRQRFENQNINVDGLMWILDKIRREPLLPAPEEGGHSEGNSYINPKI